MTHPFWDDSSEKGCGPRPDKMYRWSWLISAQRVLSGGIEWGYNRGIEMCVQRSAGNIEVKRK